MSPNGDYFNFYNGGSKAPLNRQTAFHPLRAFLVLRRTTSVIRH